MRPDLLPMKKATVIFTTVKKFNSLNKMQRPINSKKK